MVETSTTYKDLIISNLDQYLPNNTVVAFSAVVGFFGNSKPYKTSIVILLIKIFLINSKRKHNGDRRNFVH